MYKKQDIHSLQTGITTFASLQEAHRLALKAFSQAYAPYSKYQVGACVISCKDSLFFSGCNVENASFGATICAERNAVTSAVNEGVTTLDTLVLVTKELASPCGICLQVLSEFMSAKGSIYLINLKQQFIKLQLSDLLPYAFSSQNL